jgi:peptidoglycan/LPS O-acetylase OafA/YrhL
MQQYDTKKLNSIDALRGFAILGVIAVHVSQKCEHLTGFLLSAAYCGNFGVQLFFVASAFTLTLSQYNRKSNEKKPLRNFFLRRYFRIAPMYYFGIVFYFLVRLIGKGKFPPDGYEVGGILTNFTFLHGFHPDTFNYIVPGGWSIGVEFIFYACFPFTIRFIRNEKHALLLLCSSVLLSICGYHFWNLIYGEIANKGSFHYYVFTTQFSNFSFGILLFYIWKKQPDMNKSLRVSQNEMSAINLFLFAMTFIIAIYLPKIHYYHLFKPIVFSLSFFFLGMALLNKEWNLFVNAFTIFIGKISFSLYVNHFIFAFYATPLLMKSMDLHPDLHFLFSFVITLAGSGLFSILTYMIIEKSGMNFSKKLITRLELGKKKTMDHLVPSSFFPA